LLIRSLKQYLDYNILKLCRDSHFKRKESIYIQEYINT